MKRPLDTSALDQLFRTARTFQNWQERPVTDEQIQGLYDLLKLGPTSMNSLPGRFVFLRAFGLDVGPMSGFDFTVR